MGLPQEAIGPIKFICFMRGVPGSISKATYITCDFQGGGSGPLSSLLDLPMSMKVSCRTGFLKDCLVRVC